MGYLRGSIYVLFNSIVAFAVLVPIWLIQFKPDSFSSYNLYLSTLRCHVYVVPSYVRLCISILIMVLGQNM